MAKGTKVVCDRCSSRVRHGETTCGSCGFPTDWATHEDRVRWEVAEWRRAAGARPARPTASRRATLAATHAPRPAGGEETAPDEPVTRAVLRALTARVAELEERIRSLEQGEARRGMLRRR